MCNQKTLNTKVIRKPLFMCKKCCFHDALLFIIGTLMCVETVGKMQQINKLQLFKNACSL
jgi:hypothetical protein